jgi:predicted choloylglycine hydrolase
MEEVSGLAQGAGISIDDALLCQVRAEASQKWDGSCTCFALTGEATADHSPLAGQNQDLEPDYSEVSIVLKVRPNDGRPRAVMFTFAGQLGYAGMNEFGVCQFTNALYDFQWHPGLPYYPLRRVMLEQRTVSDCIKLLRKFRMCSAVNFVLADGAGDIADVEVRPEGVAVFNDTAHRRLHTNHYLTERFAARETLSLKDSAPRLARVRELVDNSWGHITVETMKNILADHSGEPAAICRHGARNMVSVSGYIAEPARGLFHIRHGAGCKQNWTTYHV